MATSSKTMAAAAPVATFESAMERLTKIVQEMESAQMPLDELLVGYEEGTRLIAICQEKLQAAEQRIEMVNRKAVFASEASASVSATPDTHSSQPSHPDVSLF